jgi:hypothetical protein
MLFIKKDSPNTWMFDINQSFSGSTVTSETFKLVNETTSAEIIFYPSNRLIFDSFIKYLFLEVTEESLVSNIDGKVYVGGGYWDLYVIQNMIPDFFDEFATGTTVYQERVWVNLTDSTPTTSVSITSNPTVIQEPDATIQVIGPDDTIVIIQGNRAVASDILLANITGGTSGAYLPLAGGSMDPDTQIAFSESGNNYFTYVGAGGLTMIDMSLNKSVYVQTSGIFMGNGVYGTNINLDFNPTENVNLTLPQDSGRLTTEEWVTGQTINLQNAISSLNSQATGFSYTIAIGHGSTNPVDGESRIFSNRFTILPNIFNTGNYNTISIEVFKPCILNGVNMKQVGGNFSNEEWSMYVTVNETTDYLINSLSIVSGNRTWHNMDMNITLNPGDTFVIKSVQPVWATNGLGVTTFGNVYFTNI